LGRGRQWEKEKTEIMDRQRYNPPVQHYSHPVLKKQAAKDLFRELEEKLDLKTTRLNQILWQGGLYYQGKRLDEKTLPAFFSDGALLEIYFFLKEPEEISLSEKEILYQAEGILAYNKPAWLPVQGSRVSIRYGLQEQLRTLTGISHLNAIHRLDRQTSGVVLFAENKKTEALLMKLFHDQKIAKKYLAWTSSLPKEEKWEMKGYLQRDFRRLPLNVYRFYSREQKNSRFSQTQFQILKTQQNYALVEAKPSTGRTHQIRVHLSYSSSPILGDDLYGGKMEVAERILLHAEELGFSWKNREIKITAPIPGDFCFFPLLG
jgi:RluA family pseudouridine synthase